VDWKTAAGSADLGMDYGAFARNVARFLDRPQRSGISLRPSGAASTLIGGFATQFGSFVALTCMCTYHPKGAKLQLVAIIEITTVRILEWGGVTHLHLFCTYYVAKPDFQ
jgi:hypothetical protein